MKKFLTYLIVGIFSASVAYATPNIVPVHPDTTATTQDTNITQVGGNVVTTTIPVSGTVTANAGSGTFAVSAASLPLPALAATSTKQSDGTQKTQVVDGSGNVIASTANALNVQCANCSGSGASAADEAAFVAGTSSFAPAGGFFQTTATDNALTNGQQGMVQLTAQRAAFANLRNASGTEVGTSGAPLRVDPTGTTTQPVSGTFFQVTQPVSLATAPSTPVTNTGTFAVQAATTIADGADVTLGAKADAKSTATDTTAITLMQVAKQISASVQAPPSQAVTNAGTFAVQSTLQTGSAQIGHLEANQSVNIAQVAGVTNAPNPCNYILPITVAINQTASTKLISQTSAKTNYVCSMTIIAQAAEIVNVVEGTGSTCGTSTAAVAGSTTASQGLSLAANGGFVVSTPISGTGTNLDLCLTQNGSNRVSGYLTYVQK